MTTGLVMSVVAMCWILGLCWVVLRQRSHVLPRVGFVGSLLVLGVEGMIAHLSLLSNEPARILVLQGLRCLLLSLAPLVWLVYSLTYARGNPHASARPWKTVLILAALLPAVPLLGFRESVIFDPAQGPGPSLHRTAPRTPRSRQ